MHKDGNEATRGRRICDRALSRGACKACWIQELRLARGGGQGVGYPHWTMARDPCERGLVMGGNGMRRRTWKMVDLVGLEMHAGCECCMGIRRPLGQLTCP